MDIAGSDYNDRIHRQLVRTLTEVKFNMEAKWDNFKSTISLLSGCERTIILRRESEFEPKL